MAKTSLFDLLGRPVEVTGSEGGTSQTFAPSETYDDDGLLPSIADVGTSVTRVEAKTTDDDGLLPSVADLGTSFTGVDPETYDDDGLLPLS